jgi:death-on-curing protein
MDTIYLGFDDVLQMHAEQIERFGGSPGIRDAGLIEAALLRPQTGYYSDLIEEAAALWESLTMNHGFIDGNKRIGLAATYTFLGLNGVRFTAGSAELLSFIYAHLEAGTFTKDNLDAWLRENTKSG